MARYIGQGSGDRITIHREAINKTDHTNRLTQSFLYKQLDEIKKDGVIMALKLFENITESLSVAIEKLLIEMVASIDPDIFNIKRVIFVHDSCEWANLHANRVATADFLMQVAYKQDNSKAFVSMNRTKELHYCPWPECHYYTYSHSLLCLHCNSVHNNPRLLYLCNLYNEDDNEMCLHAYFWIGNMTRHIRELHFKTTRYECEICFHSSKRSHDLNRHRWLMHELPSKKLQPSEELATVEENTHFVAFNIDDFEFLMDAEDMISET